MCGCGEYGGGPPYGVPIEEETHNQYSQEVKDAWVKFDAWFKEAYKEAESRFEAAAENFEHSEGRNLTLKEINNLSLIDRKTMPADVKAAMELILITPIPGYEDFGKTGEDSCYMIMAQELMTDEE